MDPYTEQRLRNEVIYLHSLWHQGPPKPPPPPPPSLNLQPLNSVRFKKTPKPNPRRKPVPKFSGKEWPVKPPPSDPPLTASGWPELKLKPKPQPIQSLTPDQLEKLKWNQVQQRALTVTKKFYSDDENDVVEDEDDDDDMVDENDDDEDVDDVEDKVYEFVMKLFNEDEELKGYYMKHCVGGGEFVCLICGGANEKFGKRFKDCVALVQHSVSVSKKTKKRRSHRAFGKAVCEVLGWEIDRLPSSLIVLDQKGNDAEVNRDVNDSKSVVDGENSNRKTSDAAECADGESMVCEDVSAVANVEEEHNKNEAEGCTGGVVVNNLCRNLSSTMVLEPVPCDLQTN